MAMKKGYTYAEKKYQVGFRATEQVKNDLTKLAELDKISVQKLLEKLAIEYIEKKKSD